MEYFVFDVTTLSIATLNRQLRGHHEQRYAKQNDGFSRIIHAILDQ